MSKILLLILLLFIVVGAAFAYANNLLPIDTGSRDEITDKNVIDKLGETTTNPLSIESIKAGDYPGSDIQIESQLDSGSNYKRYIASYTSDGLKIYGLLTVPNVASTTNRVPAIVFGHGYIPPDQYRTTERYVAYVDGLAREGYVVFKIDYRGHGDSEGEPTGAYFSPGYTIDTLNAAASLRKLPYVDSGRIGVWGHSMAGMVIGRILAARPAEFKAAVLWGAVIGSYEDLQREWWSRRRPNSFTPSNREVNANRPSRQLFIREHGEPKDGNEFWDSISPKAYLSEITTPIQLDHGESDETVPVSLSIQFADYLRTAGKTVELNTYPGDDHDISQNFNQAMQDSVAFFNKYLK